MKPPTSTPAISVVMSVFNGETFLVDALESILKQTFTDFEFVIIDDGSTDRTPEILSEYAKRDERVRVYSHENTGRAESLNRGIALAKAPLIARMDADDIAFPRRLEQQCEFMKVHPEIGLLGGAIELVTSTRRRFGVDIPPLKDDELRTAMARCNPFRHPTVIMRKETVLDSGGYRKPLLDADDYDLWLRMAERTQIANLPQILLSYRVHANQVSVRNMTHQALCCWAARTAATARARGLPDPLNGCEEITLPFAHRLGLKYEEIRRDAVAARLHWMGLLGDDYPDAALELIDHLLHPPDSASVERAALASASLKAASIHFRQKRFATAFALVGRGVLAQPVEALRIAKMAIARRVLSTRAFRQDTP